MKVLIVDDEPNILMSLDFLMRKEGYDVLVARNGTEALDSLAHHQPDLVLLDIMMPDVDGYEICRYIRNTTEHQHCKVIFMSAKSKESDIQKGYDTGADLYITKPFSNKILVAKVKELLHLSTHNT